MSKTGLRSYISLMEDPRIDRKKLHQLEDIVFITIAAVLSGAESWNEIELFGKQKKPWLSTFLALPNGIPSHDTFNRFFSILDPLEFESCFRNWVDSLAKVYAGDIVAIDGKTIRGSRGKGVHSAAHLVSAWSKHNQLIIGQIQVDQKSNEITAIPVLLEKLLLEGSIITIDAMGCQKEIARKIRSKRADYVLAVKENQGELLDDILDSFKMLPVDQTVSDLDFGHGRIETRVCSVISDLSLIEKPHLWKSLSTIIRIESHRHIKSTGITQSQTRYYISSLEAKAEVFQQAIRSHWSIENNLHWSLDVVFNEDANRKRARNAAFNFSLVNRVALSLLKKDQMKIGLKAKRLLAGWDNEYLLSVLGF